MKKILLFICLSCFLAAAGDAPLYRENFSSRNFEPHFTRSVVKFGDRSMLQLRSVRKSDNSGVVQGRWKSDIFEASANKITVIDYQYNPVSVSARYALCVKDRAEKSLIIAIQDGKRLKFANANDWSDGGPVKLDNWQHIRYIVDNEDRYYDVYVDDMQHPKLRMLKFRAADAGMPAGLFIMGAEKEESDTRLAEVSVRNGDRSLLRVESGTTEELRLHWNFSDLEKGIFRDRLKGTAAVLTGSGYEENYTAGLDGMAFRFDTGRNSAIIEDNPEISLSDDFTIECMVLPEKVDRYRTIIWKGDRSRNPEAINYLLGIRDGRIEFKGKDANGNWWVFNTKEKVAIPEKWLQISLYYWNGLCEIHVNGRKQDVSSPSLNLPQNKLITNDCRAEIGQAASPSSPGAYFQGIIDDLKIYSGRHIASMDSFKQNLPTYEKRKTEYLQIQNAVKERKAAELKHAYREFLSGAAAGNAFFLRSLPVSLRLTDPMGFPEQLKTLSTKAELSGARGETESFQLLVFCSPEQGFKVDKIQFSGFEPSFAGTVSIGRIGFVNTEKPGIPVEFTGPIPDPVFTGEDSFAVEPGKFVSVLVKINIGNSTPGTYLGHISVGSQVLPVRLTVWDFELPVRSSLKTAFCFAENYYRDYYKLKELTSEQRRSIENFLLEYRLSPVDIYSPVTSPPVSSWPYLKDKTNCLMLPSWNAALGAERYAEDIAKAKVSGVCDDLYFYSYDELQDYPARFPKAVADMKIIAEKYPDLKRMQTSFPTPEIIDAYNVWCPLFGHFAAPQKLKQLGELKKRGDEIWWYPADGPTKPYPNFFLDYPVFDCRIVGVLSYLYQVDGMLYWRINREWVTNQELGPAWQENQWRPYIFNINDGSRKFRNGMGNLVYPGRNGELLPSLRLENLRDGLEDYEYLALLKKLSENLPEGDRDRIEAERLLVIPPVVAKAMNNYSANPQFLMQYREQIAHMIEKLNKRNKK